MSGTNATINPVAWRRFGTLGAITKRRRSLVCGFRSGNADPAVHLSMDGIGKAQQGAIGGLQRAGEMMNRAASQMARLSVNSSNAANVSISSAGRSLAEAGDTATQDSFEEPLIGSTVAKHLATANIKVLQTTDETLRELTKIKR